MKNIIQFGDCREIMRQWAQQGVQAQTCVTSPPYYGLRDYGHDGQIGHEETVQDYVDAMVDTFRAVRDVLADDGTLWLNLGDSYASYRDGKATPDTSRGASKGTLVPKGSARNRMAQTFAGTGIKHKDLMGIPWRVALALQDDGWYLRQDIIWHKPNPMPESVQDRCTKAHEYIFLLTKQGRYYYDNEAIKEPAAPTDCGGDLKRNRRSVWSVTTKPYKGAHFAVFPQELIQPCVLAGSRMGDTVLDPFMGSGTTALVATTLGRDYLGCELNPEYKALQDERLAAISGTIF